MPRDRALTSPDDPSPTPPGAREPGWERPRLALVPPAATTDDVAARAAAGDRAAFERLLREHYDRMHRLAWRLTGSAHDAEDVVQEVCCALVERIRFFRGDSKVTTWLFGIVANACLDHHRRKATTVRLRDGFAILARLAAAPDGRDLYRRTWLASALGRLDPALRATLALVVGEGLTHAEAGEALGIAEATVSWRLHEVRRQMGSTFNLGDLP